MLTFLAMDFSRVGAVQALSGAFRARVQWKEDGHLRECPGPRRPTREAAEEDLESMRAAASGMSREDGFAAMKVEADALKAGKPPKEIGFVELGDNAFRARVQFRDGNENEISLGRGGQTRKRQKTTLLPYAPQQAAGAVRRSCRDGSGGETPT